MNLLISTITFFHRLRYFFSGMSDKTDVPISLQMTRLDLDQNWADRPLLSVPKQKPVPEVPPWDASKAKVSTTPRKA